MFQTLKDRLSITMQRFRLFVAAVALFATGVVAARAQDAEGERFASLEAGTMTYSNVLVMNKTKTDVFFRHAGGLTTVKVKDLDKTTQLQLGYHLVLETPTNRTGRAESSAPLAELDPRFEEIKEQIIWEAQEYWSGLDRNVIYAGAGGVALLYLFFCFCCHLICRKAGRQPGILVWLPLLKQIPLLQAAGMKPWWFIAMFIPGINVIIYIAWSFKIARTRGKGTLTAILLLLPLLNVLAFLYLAFSESVEATESAGPRKLTTLGQPQRRHAA